MSNELTTINKILTATPIVTEATKAEKVLQLTIELIDAKQRKKDSAKTYTTEIARINEEIAELLSDDTETEKTND
jgi:hypothetical protein